MDALKSLQGDDWFLLGDGDMPLPQAKDFHFRYGEGSFAAHRREAERLALPFTTLVRPGLSFDVDQPGNLEGWHRG